MPTIAAVLAASVAGWLVGSPVRAVFGPVAAMAASLVVSAVAFYYARRVVSDLRGD